MNTNSNTYTIIYSTVMVVIVAAVLAYVSVSLSGKQQANVNTETRQSILSSVNLGQGADEASDKNAYVEQEFNKYITRPIPMCQSSPSPSSSALWTTAAR